MASVSVSRFGVMMRSSGGAVMRVMRERLAAGTPALAVADRVAGAAGGSNKRCVSTVGSESHDYLTKHTRAFTTRKKMEEQKQNNKPNGNKVVVIGGGYAGIEAAKGLDKTFDVALVAGGESFRHVMYGLRASIHPEQTPRMLVPYDNLLKNGTVKTCKASKINDDECTVDLATGESLPYDYLVLATGSLHPKTPGFGNRAVTNVDQTTVFKQASAELKAAQNILVIGGGPVGVEMAGEIMEEMPGKNVTLVTAKELMPSSTVAFPDKFRTRLRQKLEEVGVTVHTNGGRIDLSADNIDASGFIPGKKTYSWIGGGMEADLCIVCTGATQTSSIYADSGLGGWLNEKGQVKVNDTLEVKEAPGTGKVFAIGDCTDLAVPKLGFLAGMEGMSVTKQIKASAAGTPLKSRKPPVVPISIVPTGKSGGVSYLPIGVVVGDFATKKIKSENVFLSKYWSDLRAGKPPVV